MNFVRTGGRFGRREPLESLAARTNYFRETYAYGDDACVAGHRAVPAPRGLRRRGARRSTAGRSIEPAIVYANLLVPGQELAVHTDVPEFRGANRKQATRSG